MTWRSCVMWNVPTPLPQSLGNINHGPVLLSWKTIVLQPKPDGKVRTLEICHHQWHPFSKYRILKGIGSLSGVRQLINMEAIHMKCLELSTLEVWFIFYFFMYFWWIHCSALKILIYNLEIPTGIHSKKLGIVLFFIRCYEIIEIITGESEHGWTKTNQIDLYRRGWSVCQTHMEERWESHCISKQFENRQYRINIRKAAINSNDFWNNAKRFRILWVYRLTYPQRRWSSGVWFRSYDKQYVSYDWLLRYCFLSYCSLWKKIYKKMKIVKILIKWSEDFQLLKFLEDWICLNFKFIVQYHVYI